MTSEVISQAKWITFLWVRRFPLGFYGPAVLPILFAFMVTTMECIGDITATTEASHLEPVGEVFDQRIQGGILADGLNSFVGALGTITPVTTYAQNNGVLSLSRCASRYAGYACCFWLFILGVIGKFAAIILTIPNCVLGGMTTFLFCGVVVSGIHVLNLQEGLNRRNRFIAIMAIGFGMGVNLVPAWVNITGQSLYPNEGNFWTINPNWSPAFRGKNNENYPVTNIIITKLAVNWRLVIKLRNQFFSSSLISTDCPMFLFVCRFQRLYYHCIVERVFHWRIYRCYSQSHFTFRSK